MSDRDPYGNTGKDRNNISVIVQLENEYKGEADFGFDLLAVAETVADAAIREENCPYEAEVSLTLVGEEEIRQLNREMRGIDRATDVLSFPMTEYASPGNFAEAETGIWDSFDPDTGRLMLGDIVISVPRVFAQAEEYGHSVKREYAFLIAHSVLHLMGYDHMTEPEENVMFAKQEKILEDIGIPRVLSSGGDRTPSAESPA